MAFTVKALRINVQMTREELCDKFDQLGVEMSPRMLADRENGISKWTGVEVIALTEIFKVNAKDLKL